MIRIAYFHKKTLILTLGLLMLISTFTDDVFADKPQPWWCINGYVRNKYYYHDTCHYDHPLLASGSGTATSANPDCTLSVTNEESFEATASCTLGISAEVVAQATIGVSIGWSQSITQTYNFDWPAGTPYQCWMYECDIHHQGDMTIHDVANYSCLSSCYPESHWHYGSYNSKKYTGATHSGQNP